MRQFLLISLVLAGCQGVVRDTKVFRTELAVMAQMSRRQGDLLERFVRNHCPCTAGQVPEGDCQKAAKTILVARVRLPWHRQMALYNAGLLDTRPPRSPPTIPDPNSLCGEGS